MNAWFMELPYWQRLVLVLTNSVTLAMAAYTNSWWQQ